MMHSRLVAPIAAAILLLGACGSDDDGSDSTAGSVSSSPAGSTAETAGNPSTTSAAPPSKATAALLTAADLPAGWQATPDDDDDDSSDEDFTAPECAALAALDDDAALQDDDSVNLVAPDQMTTVVEGVTVAAPDAVKRAYDVFASDATIPCFNTTFTAQLQEPGALSAGLTIDGVTFAREALQAGEEAVGYVATVTVTDTKTGITAPIGVRVDAVRATNAISLLITISKPGAEPVDAVALAAAAGKKLAAVA